MVRAVTFDAVETIIHDTIYPPEQYFAELCRFAGAELSGASALEGARARKRFQEAQRSAESRPVTTDWYRARHEAGLRAAGLTGNLDPLIERLRAGVPALRKGWVLDPDIPAVLDALLEKGVLLAVVSNFDKTLSDLLASLGVARYFRVITASAAVGVAKPDPRIYTCTCDALGVRPEQCLHVGDSPDNDGGVARAVGARAVIYDPLDCLHTEYTRVAHLMDVLTVL